MAKAPDGDVSTFDGSGTVWFKVYQISAVTNGGTSISWPAQDLSSVIFTLPSALPTGQYLVRLEAIALHVASTFGGAQFYVRALLYSVPDQFSSFCIPAFVRPNQRYGWRQRYSGPSCCYSRRLHWLRERFSRLTDVLGTHRHLKIQESGILINIDVCFVVTLI